MHKRIATFSLVIAVITMITSNQLKFDNDGQFISKWGTFGSNPSELAFPSRLKIDFNGQ
jgi:hypothetical protein